MTVELQKVAATDIPSGTYELHYGLYAVVKDSDTPMERLPKRNGKCEMSKLSANTCQCWKCRGLSSNPASIQQRTPTR